ncbi:hypothetical protein C7Y66_11865 [Chroococcidiopsis sp. CCALA 051]|uniref:hypothetical protein n=1 Tax=Chroococcidiopsis sp. CCALA 051 TaxID=869949 RepID=UPI000D0DA852|nr:hypothetical protein [Chroococcidiopsis sp. CCALA 051]MBE9014589.1 hypothetical protein [Chroococcidiopsidales cyanobacterium LEGE 13417]PSM48948.1 hypothetical protein C7Y66_11865 [Chroococcidiopsis sp. CCALA 051]
MQDFVSRSLPGQGKQLLQQLGDRLREFGQTPLLLEMLCNVFKETGRVPSHQSGSSLHNLPPLRMLLIMVTW